LSSEKKECHNIVMTLTWMQELQNNLTACPFQQVPHKMQPTRSFQHADSRTKLSQEADAESAASESEESNFQRVSCH